MSWLRALKETARAGLRVERARLEPLTALRAAAGLAVVIAAGLAFLGPGAAASSAFGAFMAAIATFQESWRPRPVLALAAGLTLAVSTFVGYLVGSSATGLFLLLLAVWAFAAGLMWAAGPTAGMIASGNVAIMLVTVTLPTSVPQAAGHAAVIAAGGVVQALLIVLFPVRRWGAQRDALADALAAEADYARRLREDPVAHFDPQPLMRARAAATVTRRQSLRRPAELHGARGLAERIRPVLASLADPEVGAPAEGPARDRVRELLAAAGAVLDAAARAIRHGEPVRLPAPSLAVLKSPDTADLLDGAPLRAAHRLAALLDDVLETAEPGSGRTAEPGESMLRPTLTALVPVVLKAVRAELRPGSPVLRHAVRVTAVTCAGFVIGVALPLGHAYWAPMTSVMVMRPDFTQTWSRAVARFGGTLVGVAVATGVVQLVRPGMYLSGFLAVLSAGLMYVLMRTGYAVVQAFVSAYVVFLLGMGGVRWDQTVPDRVALTLVGGVLAMLGYALYPASGAPPGGRRPGAGRVAPPPPGGGAPPGGSGGSATATAPHTHPTATGVRGRRRPGGSASGAVRNRSAPGRARYSRPAGATTGQNCPVRYLILGVTEARDETGAPLPIGGARLRALLAALALRAGGPAAVPVAEHVDRVRGDV
ncbi:FUSC family protein, partial [Streptomyces sp. NPDC059456]|uniref:FUSC family protein n=1 Tax=Streptomyces sp. NPDC059456 TaxID=3346838 RepID=UPI0036AD2227